MPQAPLYPEFQNELSALLNRHSIDNACNTPDFILAGMLTEVIETYRKTVNANINWHAPSAIGNAAEYQPPRASDITSG